ncbi:XdhC family protein [Hyphomicrobium sulfonivorans]|uniref:XdhC family protein n=1 Tax=Hyphomicrobium sulfonivorans TaxID=121290 RepID=UPI00156F1F84|nr:XdhC/CoxI family protein [Hyphomicrobium sulfonivorans]MBI1651343.1 XdhC family protein [Hyphomicrobium sulfonivorans]NSL72794.1 XdhC/CoxI family protein [Hyphomicrobium sulfonivorans]
MSRAASNDNHNDNDATRSGALTVWQLAREWIELHGAAAVVTVVDTWGTAPAPVGTRLVIAGNLHEGDISGGCVEDELVAVAEGVIAEGAPRVVDYDVSDEAAWHSGLACGGRLKVVVEPLGPADTAFLDTVIAAEQERRPVVVTTRIADGTRTLYAEGDALPVDVIAARDAATVTLTGEDANELFVQPLLPPVHVVIVGAALIAQALVPLARQVGYRVSVVDPRREFMDAFRSVDATTMVAQPPEAFAALGLDARTAVVALAHTSAIDDATLIAALRAPCVYIGALGSRTNQGRRLERLRAEGFSDADLARIHGPVGLPIGAKGPAEIAVSILAEIIKVVRGAS